MDAELLKYEIAKNNLKVKDVCESLHMSKSAFYRKCKGDSEFTRDEIEQIIELLHIENPMPIFFKNKVS